jgi:hypothetical protein
MDDENSRSTSHKDLARGADGALYLISKDKDQRPIKLSTSETRTVNQILKDLEKELAKRMKDEVSIVGSGVNLPPPPPFHPTGH